MNCQEFENLLSDYLEQALDPLLRRQATVHVMQCPPCRTLLEEVGRAILLCRQAGFVEPVIDLPDRILRATAAGQMMSCAIFDELILDYFEGFITASDFHIFEAHFASCPRCRRLMKGIQQARQLCQIARSVEMPAGLPERILKACCGSQRLAREQGPKAAVQRLRRVLIGGLRVLARPLLTPELVTAVMLCLATLGLLLVEFSEDRSLSGVYRHARQRLAAALSEDKWMAASPRPVVSELHAAARQVGRFLQASLTMLSAASDADQSVPASQSSPDRKPDQTGQRPDSRPMAAPPSISSQSQRSCSEVNRRR